MGKGRLFSDSSNDEVYNTQTNNENYVLSSQQNAQGLGGGVFNDSSGYGNFRQSGRDQRNADLKGALFRGNLGFLEQSAFIDATTNTLNLLVDQSNNPVAETSTDRFTIISGLGTSVDLITILGAQRPGQRLRIYNTDGNTITIKNTGSATPDTIFTPGAVDFVLSGNDVVDLTYDIISAKWRIVGVTGGGTPSTSFPILYPKENLTPAAGGTATINLSVETGNAKQIQFPAGNISFEISNDPANTVAEIVRVMFIQDGVGNRMLTSVDPTIKDGALMNSLLDPAANAKTIFELATMDGGITYHVMLVDLSQSAGGLLSTLAIDIDKDWAGRFITNIAGFDLFANSVANNITNMGGISFVSDGAVSRGQFGRSEFLLPSVVPDGLVTNIPNTQNITWTIDATEKFQLDGPSNKLITSVDFDMNTFDILSIDRATFVNSEGVVSAVTDSAILLNSSNQFQFNTAETNDFVFSLQNIAAFIIDKNPSISDQVDVTIQSDSTNLNSIPLLNISRSTSIPPSPSTVGSLVFKAGTTAASGVVEYAAIVGGIEDNAGGSVDGSLSFDVTLANSVTPFMTLNDNSDGVIKALRDLDMSTFNIFDIDQAKFVADSTITVNTESVILLNTGSQFQFNTAETNDFVFSFDNNAGVIFDHDTVTPARILTVQSDSTDINSTSQINITRAREPAISLQTIGQLGFRAPDDTNAGTLEYASIVGKIEDASTGSIDGSLGFDVTVGGSPTRFMNINDNNNGIIEALKDVTLVNTSLNPVLTFFRNQTGVTNNALGNIIFRGQQSNNNPFTYSRISSEISDATLGQEDSIITLSTTNDGILDNVRLVVNADSSQILRFSSETPTAGFIAPEIELRAIVGSVPPTGTVKNIGDINFDATTNDAGGIGAVEEFAKIIVDQEESDITNESGSMRFRVRDQTATAGALKTYLQFNDGSSGIIEALKDLKMGAHFVQFSQITVPADATVGNSEGNVFFDNTTDPPILKIKKKSSVGVVSIVSLEGTGGGGISFPIDFPEETDRGTVTTNQTINFTDSTRHSVAMTVGTATITLDLTNPPTDKLALSSITMKQDPTGGRTFSFVPTVGNAVTITDAFAALSGGESISFMVEFERGFFTAYLKTGNIVSGGGGSLSEPIELGFNEAVTQTPPAKTLIRGDLFNPTHVALDKSIELQLDISANLSKYKSLFVIFDTTGGSFTVTWPPSVTNPPIITDTVAQRISVILYTIDNGTTWTHATSTGSSTGGEFTGPMTADHNYNNFSVTGAATFDFFQAGQSIQNKADPDGGILYNVNNLQSHIFRSVTDEIARFEEAAPNVFRLDMLNHKIINTQDISFDLDAVFAGAGATPTIGYDDLNNLLHFNVPTGKQFNFIENNASGGLGVRLSPASGGSITCDVVNASVVLQLGSDPTAPLVVGEIKSNGTDITAFSGGALRNFSDIGSPSNEIVDGDSKVLVTDSGVPTAAKIEFIINNSVAGSFTNLSFLPVLPIDMITAKDIVALSKLRFTTNTDTIGVTEASIAVRSSDMLFNVTNAVDEYQLKFAGVLKHTFTQTQLTSPNIILSNTLTFNDNAADPIATGIFARNGSRMKVESSDFVVQRTTGTGNQSATLSLVKIDASPAGGDNVGALHFSLLDSPTETIYAQIIGEVKDPTDSGKLSLQVRADNATLTDALVINGGNNNVRSYLSIPARITSGLGFGLIDETGPTTKFKISPLSAATILGMVVQDNAGFTVGNAGTNAIPMVSSLTATAAGADAAFGDHKGAMGFLDTGSVLTLFVRQINGDWGAQVIAGYGVLT